MTTLPQTPCPHCQAPVNFFAPGCFNCRNQIQWPAPANEQQAALAQAAAQVFQQQWTQLQQQQPPQAPAPAAPAAAGGGSVPTLEGLEATRLDVPPVDPAAVSAVEGLLPSRLDDGRTPVSVAPMEDLQGTQAQQTGQGLGITGFTAQDGFEGTHLQVGAVQTEALSELDRGNYVEATRATTTVAADTEVERTAVGTETRSPRKPTRRAAEEAKRVCRDCGNISQKEKCPACGAPTKELPAA